MNTLETAGELARRHAACFSDSVRPALAAADIEILRWKQLAAAERRSLHQLFRERIYPVLTPLVVDPAHPFPYISGLSLSLAVMIADQRTGRTMFARVKVPPLLPRFLTVAPYRFVPMEDVIAAHLPELFKGLDVIEHHVFRVTRGRDLEIDEDVTEDLLKSLERELTRRRFGPAVRLEVEESMSSDMLDSLETELGVDTRAVYRLPGPLDLSGLSAIADLDLPKLKYPAFVPSDTALPADTSIFSALAERDVLVHLPYDSFAATVQRLVVSAAADPRVLAIKQTLYRTSGDSEIVDALIDAAESGKQVVVVVEIKARFDERPNIAWARRLEEAGCHVVYGSVGLKTHCKTVLVVREEPDGSLRRFCHVGTGNYHPTTARLYEDFGLLTADSTVGAEITDLFNHLTAYSQGTGYRRLLVAPEGLRPGLLERVNEQAERARRGQPARIRMKCNAITDEAIIDSLYRASQAGVPIDLWVRGICTLRPGLPGVSETIRVRSVLGRFLEHSRVYVFGTGDDGTPPGEVWLGSADLMHRNLDRRVEALIRVVDPAQQAELDRSRRPGNGRQDRIVVAGAGRVLDQAPPGRLRCPPARHSGILAPGPAAGHRRNLTCSIALSDYDPSEVAVGRPMTYRISTVSPVPGSEWVIVSASTKPAFTATRSLALAAWSIRASTVCTLGCLATHSAARRVARLASPRPRQPGAVP